jgi:DNA polymerase-3 subunit epsilon
MFQTLIGIDARRKRLLKKAPAGPLRDFLAVPFPDPSTPLDKTPILAVDFETTGLDAVKDQILSIGFIEMENCEILVSSAYHQVINTRGNLDEKNVIIHQITDSHKSTGEALNTAVEALLQALAGKVMLVHFGRIEKTFLTAACRELYGLAPIFPMIDTLFMAKRRMDMRTAGYDPSELRLFQLRDHHGLPAYSAHNALSDALATAELFLVETALMNRKKSPPLKAVVQY